MFGDQASSKQCLGGAGNAFVKDQLQLVRPSEVQVIAQHLLEEQTSRQGTIKNLCSRELRLLDEQFIAMTGRSIFVSKWLRQSSVPLVPERLKLCHSQTVANGLQPLGIGAR